MTQTTARIKQKGKNFEILVDLDRAVSFKKFNSGSIGDILEIDEVYSDVRKGLKASKTELEVGFGTDDIYEIATLIVKNGEILLTQEYRDEEREKRMKQIVEYITRNAVDPRTGLPHTPDRVNRVLDEAGVNVTNRPVEEQMPDIIEKIRPLLPIKIQTKRLKIVIPAIHTGKAYGIVNPYKESEDWLSDGSLQVIVAIPAGAVMDFYDKLNNVTHGSALSEEIKE